MEEIQQHITKLIEQYCDFQYKVSEYEVVNNKIKKDIKQSNNKRIVNYYSLRLKLIDKSFYSEELIPYLIKNRLNNFIIKGIDEVKLSKLIEENKIDRDFAMLNIEKEKTVLDIRLKKLPGKLEEFKEQVKEDIKTESLFDLVKKRERLKSMINIPRYKYYSEAKKIKDLLAENEIYQYRFQHDGDVGFVKIRIKEREYSKSFIDYIETNKLDALKLSIDNQKLLKSRSKKLDREFVNKYKTEKFQENLYVAILKNVLVKAKNG